MNDPIVIVGAARTPMGAFQGDFSAKSAHDLGAVAIQAAVERAGVDGKLVEHVYFGNCLMAGQGQAPARQALLKAGLPTSTGAAKALRLVIPEVDGILDGLAYRVPTPTVSVVEVVALVNKKTNRDEVNSALQHWSGERMKGIMDITQDPVVSMDMKGNQHSSIIDGLSTNVVDGDLVKVVSWYDNEWGYACRLADLTAMVAEKGW